MGWLRSRYPQQHAQLFDSRKGDSASTAIDVLEYIDPEWVWMIAARRETDTGEAFNPLNPSAPQQHFGGDHVVLRGYPNRVGRTLVVAPGQITLGPRRSPYHQIKGMYQAAAEMDAWARHATAKGINSETWFVGQNGETPVIEQAADALNSIPGIVTNGQMETVTTQPQFAARTAVGDMERAQRLTAQLPSELGGEAASNVRTGRRSDQLLSAVLDFPIQEAHELFQDSIELENEMAALIDLNYFRRVPKVFAVNFAGEKGDLAYTPGELWTKTSDNRTPAVHNRVSYFMAGVDAADRIIAIGQRIGMGTLSKETAMRMDPVVDDVEGEMSRVVKENLDAAFLSKIQGLAADPASPMTAGDLASLKKHVSKGLTLEDAWEKVQAEIQKRQEEAAAPGPTALGPEVAEPPGAVPPSIAGPSEGSQNLSQMLGALRSPQVFATPQG
jgi:hypothetical protein